MTVTIAQFIEAFGLLIVVSGLIYGTITTLQLFIAFGEYKLRPMASNSKEEWLHYAKFAPTISILVPAYNEEQTLIDNVRALLDNEYPNFEIIVINDGSSDSSMELLKEEFELFQNANAPSNISVTNGLSHRWIRAIYASKKFENLKVIDKQNGGKSDALNAGVNFANGEYVCVIDADSILDKDALFKAAKYLIDAPNKVVAVGGAIRVVNGCQFDDNEISQIALPKTLLPLLQTLEYLRTFHISRTAMSAAEALSLISGAFGLFSRDLIVRVGGYSHETVGEDFELCLRIRRYLMDTGQSEKMMIYCPDAICWTQTPDNLASLRSQRIRWQRGALEALNQNRKLMLNPKYGRVGTVSTFESLISDVITPLTEFVGHIITPIAAIIGIMSPQYFIAYFSISSGFGVLHSVGAIILEEMRFRRYPNIKDLFKLYLVAIIENFGYRQICGLWRIQGFWQYITGEKKWGTILRRSFRAAQ